MNQKTSPITEEYWSQWIEWGDGWRDLAPNKKAAILEKSGFFKNL